MSTQSGNNATNNTKSLPINIAGSQDKNTGYGFSSGLSNVGGGCGCQEVQELFKLSELSRSVGGQGGSNVPPGNPSVLTMEHFTSVSKNTQDLESGRYANISMPQSL